ncbi:MAG: STAS domain-containing protein [Burkholderiales bacterium]|nr:STAS domain-containing protein [Burkholderiales bacterium]
MAFSIFNKKGSDPPKPAAPRPRPAAEKPAAEKPAAHAPEAPARPAAPDPIEFSAGGGAPAKAVIEHGFQGNGKARAPARPAAAPGRKPDRGGPNSVMTMEIQESPFEAAPALEEAAILYANRQDAAAQGALEEAILADDIPAQATRQAWLMLFDLLENQGRHADFETAAIKYAVRFETSPPTFSDRSTAKAERAAAPGVQAALSGRLDAAASRQFDQIRAQAARHRALVIDVAKVEDITDEGSIQLRACLATLAKSGHAVTLAGADALIALIAAKTEVGRAEVPETFWLLLLDLYQACGRQAEFEETALSYCITYEVSPPSWVDAPRAAAAGAASAPGAPEPDPAADAFYIRGEVEGSSESAFKGLTEFAAEREVVVIDVYHLKRLDFIAAGALLNLVAALKTAGKQVEIRSPSPLLATLLVTMGFTAYAKMVRRKA